jgi:hypothetical protein
LQNKNPGNSKLLDSIERTPELAEFVIQGITRDGSTFRPANWGDRLSDMLSTTGQDGRILYSAYLRPMIIQGTPSVVVRFSLEKADPDAFELVRQFVSSNQLKVRAGRNRMQAGETQIFFAVGKERRSQENNGW